MLKIASYFYGLGVWLRNRMFDAGILRSERFDIPIICIGNITAGGTGKTPMAETIIAHFAPMRRVALLSRGYGRRTEGYIEVEVDSFYRDTGDEPLQIKLKYPQTLVVVCEKRAEAIRRIREEHPEIDLIVMDDGFQHRRVEAKVNIVVVDATRPIDNDSLLPYGRLRDTKKSLSRAAYFVVTKCPEDMSPLDIRLWRKSLVSAAYQMVYFSRLENSEPRALYPDEADVEVREGGDVILVAGIGNPHPFEVAAAKRYNVRHKLIYEDHHVYRVRDARDMASAVEMYPDAAVIMTEKDAVKLRFGGKIPAQVRRRLYYVPVRHRFIDGLEDNFLKKLEKDVKQN